MHGDGNKGFRLPLEQESDGSIRYLNLLPILYWAGKRQHSGVYLIDELEDSLHPKLTEELIRLFLDASGPDEQRQLIFTTHELHLLRVDLLRRDEIWLVEKNDHRSELTRLTDFPASDIRSVATCSGCTCRVASAAFRVCRRRCGQKESADEEIFARAQR